MSKAKRKVHVEPLTPDQSAKLMAAMDAATTDFIGQFDELESALGMMILGRLVGWKVLALIHNKRTIKKYEEILGINVREAFPEVGPLAHKSVAFVAAEKLGAFWKAVSGEIKLDDRRALTQ
jgi:hypothetical protein